MPTLRRSVLLLGANGFIGAGIATALEQAGWQVVKGLRHPRDGDPHAVTSDLARDLDASTWAPRLQGIDAVVNCAGILREVGGATFEAVHHHAPRALVEACRAVGVRRVVQVSAIGDARGQVIEVVGPAELTLIEYLSAWRRWLGAGPASVLRVPQALVGIACGIGEALGRGPLGRTMQRMLARGNVGAPGAAARMSDLLGVAPRSLDAALAARPAEAQDRAHASLYLLYPIAVVALAFVWIASAIAGFAAPVADLRALAQQGGLPADAGPPMVRALSALDLALGIMVLHPRSATFAAWLMLASVAGYTVVTGLLWPAFWLEPLGGLVKNAAIVPLILFVLAWQRPRGAS